jgi:methylenetetrahydrofolate reductase (NADPH)
MRVTDHLAAAEAAGKTLFTFEILPPLKGASVQAIYQGIDPLMEFNPPFVNVTYHREEYIYKEREGGLLERVAIRKRPGTVGICSAIMHKYGIDTVPHIVCGGFSKEETENALIDLHFLGIENVLVLRGDAIKTESHFKPHPLGHAYATDLLNQVTDMNNGVYLDEDVEHPVPTNFCIGVAGYPEKHFESPSIESDLRYLKEKVDGGAGYIVTQMFFDNSAYFRFVERCRAIGITVPIIPGLKPLTTKGQLINLPKFFKIDLPDDLVRAVVDAKDNKEVTQVGIEWAIAQCKELVAAGVPTLHFYTMGKSEATKTIARAVF